MRERVNEYLEEAGLVKASPAFLCAEQAGNASEASSPGLRLTSPRGRGGERG